MERNEEIVWLRPPVEPGASGARGSWRVVSRWLPHERRKGRNWERTSRDEGTARLLLEERRATVFAYLTAQQRTEQVGTAMPDPSVGEQPFGDVANAWYDHQVATASWSESQRKAQLSLLRNWLLHDDIRVPRSVRAKAPEVALRDLPVRDLTPVHLDRALSFVYNSRSHATYLKVRQQVRTILAWARANGACPPQVDPAASLRRLQARPEAERVHGRVLPSRIPTDRAIDELAAAAEALTGDWWRALEINLLARCGMRIGELLGIRNDPALWHDEDGQLWVHLQRQWNGEPLKGRKERWVPIPGSLAPLVRRRRGAVAQDGFLFCAPEGGRLDPDNWRTRIFNPAAERAGWPQRSDFRADHDDHGGADTVVCRKQGTRRWQHPPHSLRHYAVTTLMAHGVLDDDDIAEIVGHTNGAQLRRMYKQTRPEAEARISRVYASL